MGLVKISNPKHRTVSVPSSVLDTFKEFNLQMQSMAQQVSGHLICNIILTADIINREEMLESNGRAVVVEKDIVVLDLISVNLL